ncbi:unnamed protein product [Calypogeia fissa]
MSKTIEKTGSTKSMDKYNLPLAEQIVKEAQLREALGPLSTRASIFCTDDCLNRFLRARNWNVKKAEKMLRETLKWRASYKPEEITWDEVAHEAETGKLYRGRFADKEGRSVIIMRPANQNSNDPAKQVRLLVHSLENAVLNLPAGQEQMVWLVDFKKWTIRQAFAISTAREIVYVFQTMYPERLKFAIVYDAPWLFERFWVAIKTFLDSETFKKVKFVYTKKPESLKVVEELFDMDDLEVALGGRNTFVYNHEEYSKQMKVDDAKTAQYWKLDGVAKASSMKLDAQEKEPSSNGI